MYDYLTEKPKIFLEENQEDFLNVMENIESCIKYSGCVTMGKAIKNICGCVWLQMAYVDRLVEIGKIREVEQGGYVTGQMRIFIK